MVNTRRDIHVSAPGEFTTPPPETLIDRRRRWSHLLAHNHYHPLISEILDAELPKYTNSSIIDPNNRVQHMRECALILASSSPIFHAAVDGTLVTRLLTDTDLQQEYTVLCEQAWTQPSIYAHFLADPHGIAPTPTQYMTIHALLQDYIAETHTSSHAHAIDNISPQSINTAASAKGYRKYLHTAHSLRSPARLSTFHRLITGIENLFLSLPSNLHTTPLPHPPAEVGYSLNSHLRIAQHSAHRSSNYVMNLVSDICTHLFRTKQLEQHFTMQPYIIYLIFRPHQAAIAEIFCSGLLQVWVDGGGGFNAYPAGRSVGSVRRVSGAQWKGYERWVRGRGGLEGNMAVQRERAEEWRRALEKEGEGVYGDGGEEDIVEDMGEMGIEDEEEV